VCVSMGVNGVTCHNQHVAAGVTVRHHELVETVSEINVAGNLKDMFINIAVANDLKLRRSTKAPTICLDRLTLADV